jgi:hypothetical protein
MSDVTLAPSDEDFLNPERGLYDRVDLAGGAPDAAGVREQGMTLAYAPVQLDDYRDKSLDDALFKSIDQGFVDVRAAGIKVVLRFIYNDGFDPDAPKDRVLEHISQLKPMLTANADVIAALQAGFIGAWGEWHSSTNGLDNPADREAILLAALESLPASRMIQIRTPMFKEDIFPGGSLKDADAWSGSLKARTGHHNDCFLASDSDMGTYEDPIAMWKQYVADDGRFTPIGGETCAENSPRSDCPTATAEMASLHWSFLNALYKQEVLAGWEAQGCLDEVKRRLGYRISIAQGSVSASVAPGGALGVTLRLKNEGYAAMYNERPVYLVLGEGAERRAARLSAVDPRRWAPGEDALIEAWLRVPADLSPGKYRLSLWMPDAAESLKGAPAYAVRLANTGVWDDATGENVIAQELSVDSSAPGSVDPKATELEEIL